MGQAVLAVNNVLVDELKEYFNVFKDFHNPVYSSILVSLIIMVVLYITMRSIVLPQRVKHSLEKKNLNLQNTRLMALFADLDPDPIIRVNSSGSIIFLNPAAYSTGFEEFMGKIVTEVFPSLALEWNNFIAHNGVISSYDCFQGRHYAIHINGINYLNIAQVYMHDVTEMKLNQEALEKSESELRNFSRYLQIKIEEERQRISRELHDGIGQNLIILKMNLQKSLSELTGRDDSSVYLSNARIIEQAITDLKSIAYVLKPRVLEEIGLVPALISLVSTIQKQSSIHGAIDFINLKERLEHDLETSIYRITQEGLSNIVKYSNAEEFNIQLINKNDSVRLIISDNGNGFDIDKCNKGMGIKNMKERAESHNGSFRISSSEEDGTVLVADFSKEGVYAG
ncbi:MAG: ATP-binding protein [Syntrophomonadaceae bacterium]